MKKRRRGRRRRGVYIAAHTQSSLSMETLLRSFGSEHIGGLIDPFE
jgi:hypothetical protein